MLVAVSPLEGPTTDQDAKRASRKESAMSADVRTTEAPTTRTPIMDAARFLNSSKSAMAMSRNCVNWTNEWVNQVLGGMYRRQYVIDGVDLEEVRTKLRLLGQAMDQVGEIIDEVRLRGGNA